MPYLCNCGIKYEDSYSRLCCDCRMTKPDDEREDDHICEFSHYEGDSEETCWMCNKTQPAAKER